MALSQINIYNQAFFALGLSRATSTTEDSKAVRAANEMYEICRDELLSAHTWNFATKRIQLTQSTTTPAFGYAYQYALPSDFLRLVRLSDKSITYRIEGTYLLTDAGSVSIQYIAQVTDPTKFSPLFAAALGLALADKIATQLTQSDAIVGQVAQKADIAFRKAKKVDALQGTPERLHIYGIDNARDGEDFGIFDGEIE